MKHILILANSDLGLYVFRKELIEELIINYRVTICTPYGERIEDFISMGCEFICTDVDSRGINPIKDISLIYKYLFVLSKIKPDLVLTYTIKPNVYGGLVCALKKVPYIVNVTGIGAAFENYGIIKSIATLLYKVGMRRCYCIFFQNRDGRDKLLQLLKKNTYSKMIPGSGVNINNFQYSDYPTNGETIIFNYVGRIIKIKGIDEFLFCAKKIKETYPKVVFNVIGAVDDHQYEKIIHEYNDLGIIRYLGHQNNMKPFLIECNAIIHASHSEGMSNVLLEHSAIGRPCITADIPGCREIVEDGHTGLLFKVGDALDMLKKIELFIGLQNEDKALMGYKARKKVEREFDRKIIVREYLETIIEALSMEQ